MYSLLKEYSDQNSEKFNKDFIYLKDKDSVVKHIRNIFEALEDVIPYLKLLDCSVNRNEATFPDWTTKKEEGKKFVNIEISRYLIINLKFQLIDPKGEEEDKIIEKYLYFPKLINHTYFIMNNNKFFPIYQIIDSATYNNNGSLTLKTLLMLLTLRSKEETFTDVYDNEYSGKIRLLDLFSNKLNYLLYFLADRGYEKTLEYFIENPEEEVVVCSEDEIDIDETAKMYNIFRISKTKEDATLLIISKDLFEKDLSLCLNLIDIFNGKSEFQIMDKTFWKLELGKVFSRNRNSYESKANDILISFKRILDNSTKETLRLDEKNKEDVFALVRWMKNDFEDLVQRDNMDLKYKRIRVYEPLCYDLLIKVSTSTYRLLNKSDITMKDLEKVFSTLSPMFVAKKMGNNELLRYMGIVNAIELFNPMLKVSFKGHQGLGGNGKNVNNKYRDLHPSYVGRLSLTTASAGDPGMSSTFSPFLQNYGFYFSDERLD